MRTLLSAGTIVAAVLLAGCGDARQFVNSLGDLQEVQRQVVAVVHDENVNVNLNNGRELTIGIVNSPLKLLAGEQKEAKAREIASVAYKALPSRASLEAVGVIFVVHRSYLFLFNYTDATDFHRFTARELMASSPGAETSSG